jgi:hypothetical protein
VHGSYNAWQQLDPTPDAIQNYAEACSRCARSLDASYS